MKLYVPACGDRIILSSDWTFPLYWEDRNTKFGQGLGIIPKDVKYQDQYEPPLPGERWSNRLKKATATLPAGTTLECDRVYIRSFNRARIEEGDDYDSITWKPVIKGKCKGRFWVKLSDCNGLEFEHDSIYRDRVKLIKQVMDA